MNLNNMYGFKKLEDGMYPISSISFTNVDNEQGGFLKISGLHSDGKRPFTDVLFPNNVQYFLDGVVSQVPELEGLSAMEILSELSTRTINVWIAHVPDIEHPEKVYRNVYYREPISKPTAVAESIVIL